MLKLSSILLFALALGVIAVFGQSEPQGVLIYRAPATSYTEAIEFRSFRQDNPLYSTLFTTTGERRQLKAGGVVAVVPYPPVTFDSGFQEVALTELNKISALETADPQVKGQLQIARGKWARALEVFRHNRPAEPRKSLVKTGGNLPQQLPPGARLTRATADSVSVTYDQGVTTLPLMTLNQAEILALNATSRTIQLPLGLDQPAAVAATTPASPATSSATGVVERTGRKAIALSAQALGVSDTTFSVWTFFVVFPGLILVLLLGLIVAGRRPRRNSLPPASRPVSRPL